MVKRQQSWSAAGVFVSFLWDFWPAWLAVAISLLVALWAAFRGRSAHRHPAMERRLRDVETDLLEALDRLDKLTVIAKRKYARDSTRAARDAKKEKANSEQMSDDDWKKQMNQKYATGWRPS